MAVVVLSDLKLALGINTANDDYELQSKIDAAEAAYARHVGPLPGTYTQAMTLPALLPRGVTSASVSGLVTTFNPRSGVLNSVNVTYGPVEVTYIVGPIAADHVEAVIADIAEYWDRTQRDVAVDRPAFSTDAGFDRALAGGRPVTLFPRIMGLAVGQIA